MKQKKLWFVIVLMTVVVSVLYFNSQPAAEVYPSREKHFPFFLAAQIDEDCKGLSITKEDLNATWEQVKNSNTVVVRYKILNGSLFASANPFTKKHPRYIVITGALERILSSQTLPDLEFIIDLEDGLDSNKFSAPILTFAKKRGADRLILIPDCEALNPDDRAYLTRVASSGRSWEGKKEQVFWRGGPSGGVPTFEKIKKRDFLNSPRFHLVELSAQQPGKVDAAFVSWNGLPPDIKECLAAIFPLVSAVNPKDHLPYKYLLDVDGNSCCYSRTYWILASNSLMLKQQTDNIQWFYKGIFPFIHYIPISCDLSDLFEKIEFCKANDQTVLKISKNATKFALSYLQYEDNLIYLHKLLQTYGEHLEFTPTLEKEDEKAAVPLLRSLYFQMKGFLRKKIKNQPIATFTTIL